MSLVFIDLETSGLDKNKHDIIQVGAIAVDKDLNEIDAFERLVHFDILKADMEALKHNNYSKDRWDRFAVHPRSAASDLSQYLNRHAGVEHLSRRGKPYFTCKCAGHNIDSFDIPFVKAWFKRNGQSWIPIDYSTLDTLSLARWVQYRKLNLGQEYPKKSKTVKPN